MELLTTRSMIRSVAARWRRQYPDRKLFRTEYSHLAHVHGALARLDGETATPEEVSSIVDPSWIAIRCDECDREVPAAVRLGEGPDLELSTALVCRGCLVRALAAIDGDSTATQHRLQSVPGIPDR